MNQQLISYIDNNIIREYAIKTSDGYSLHIVDLDEHEKSNLIDRLFSHDPILKELILDRAQELINERIEEVEAEDNQEKKFPLEDWDDAA
jgi:hypothetical protein